MRKNKLFLSVMTAVLVVATLEITSPQLAVSSPPAVQQVDSGGGQGLGCILFIIIAVVVTVIIWGLIQMCKRIPPPPPPDNGQPTNITIAVQITGLDTVAQFVFDPARATNCLVGGSVTDESNNVYQLMCSYQLLHSSSPNGPWTLDGLVTNWMGGTMNLLDSNHVSMALSMQEIALYDTNGVLQSARRWTLSDFSLSNAIMPKIVMPPMHLPEQFYRLVLLEQ